MTAGIIVVISVLFAGVFTIAYLVKPNLRKQIEAPKFLFQEQIRQYNVRPEQADEKPANDS